MDEIDELLDESQAQPKKENQQEETEEENSVAKKFKKLLKEFKYGFDIDFSNNVVTFNIVAPEIEIVKVKTEENGEIIEKTDVVAHVVPHKIFQRSFKSDSDYINIKINNKTYEIPDFYNKKMLKQKDTKPR